MTAAKNLEFLGDDHFALRKAKRRLERDGPGELDSNELLALVLGRGLDGVSPTQYAHRLLEDVGGVQRLSRLRPPGLRGRPGLGTAQAARISAAFELGRRAARDSTPESCEALTCEQVEEWARPRLSLLEHEEVWVLCVNGQSHLKSTWMVGRGGIHGCALLARDILTPVVRDAASGFVLVHNHPSGDPSPSREDIELTHGLQVAASAIAVPLLDHVIVSRHGARSLFELGLLK